MFTAKGKESLDNLFHGLDNMSITAYIGAGNGVDEVRDILNRLKDAHADERPALIGRLEYLCEEYDVDIELFKESEERFLQSFPDKEDVINCLTEHYYRLCKNAPSPVDYISHLTDTMISIRHFSEFENAAPNEPTRLKILKRYIAGSPRDWKTFDLKYFYTIAEKGVTDEEKSKTPLSPVETARRMKDSLFDLLKKIKITPSQMIRLIVRQTKDLIARAENEPPTNTSVFTDINVSGDVRDDLRSFCSAYGIDASAGSICSVLAALDERLSADETAAADFDEHAQELTELLEEQFRKTLINVKYTAQNNKLKTGGELWKYRKRDHLRVLYRKIPEDARTALPLLEHCENMANGYFCKNSLQNRINLYIYAIMFGMTCDLGIRDKRDNQTDISKNLFEDFYCDNMTRFMQSDTNMAATETEPDGASVNYKRYTDMIYIYYLVNQKEELPGSRVDKANSVIIECINKAASDTDRARSCDELLNDINATYRYRKEVAGDVVNCPEEDLADLIYDHFDITDDEISRVNLNATALRNLNKVMQDIENSDEENYQTSALSSYLEASELFNARMSEAEEKGLTIDGDEKKKLNKEISVENERWLIQRQIFNRQFLDMLKERYKDDKAFLKMIGKISLRVDEMSNTFLRNKLKEVALKELYFADKPMLLENLKSKMGLCIGAGISGEVANAAVDDLVRMGFDIERSTETMRERDGTIYRGNTQKESHDIPLMSHPPEDVSQGIAEQLRRSSGTFYQLHSRKYPNNAALQEIMDNMPSYYTHDELPKDGIVTELLKTASQTDSRVTRSRLLTALANRYLYGDTVLPDSLNRRWQEYDDMYYFEDLRDPADVFDVFAVSADDMLIESGFQPLSPKNVYDMYLLFSILMYFICNEADR